MAEPAGSLSEWLALREPVDALARSHAIADAVVASMSTERPVCVVDLGTGAGSNIRYLAPRLPTPQRWLAVDRDPDLLARIVATSEALRRHDVVIETRRLELGVLDRAMLQGSQLVTASALLDLVSAEWIERLAGCCLSARASILFTLTYDGRSSCDPFEPEDDLVRELFNGHQRASDKGFGRAAGPEAAAVAIRTFGDAGYEMRQERSDWHLTPASRDLQRWLVTGWAEAAVEVAPERAAAIAAWLRRRLTHVHAGRSTIVVGHVDLGGWPIR